MNEPMKAAMEQAAGGFRLPRYGEITDVGLYLEQTIRFINGYLAPFNGLALTPSMLSNYVKQRIVAPPVKKLYGADQIASLFFIAVAKAVMSLEDIRLLFMVQKGSYPLPTAFDYFCAELENVLQFKFGLKARLDDIGKTQSEAKVLLRNVIIAVVDKLYLDQYVQALRGAQAKEETKE